ncbi:MarR family winged helix-turn-helix transcriptional regulator [Microbacterium invictum]|uniref:DNA-binding MarR family transcriptional regulator n=1 Tax=Microbacterium invictum TaxID=515415 RepID=A0AA40SR57_9MICO|nr:MarR family winged helix-turn-helix transcriptional regulator [Microbacterium invictum]MBB4140863.1 DNA-binding MarR family transcriptional regulator [Microbacterium invictum]
MTDSDASAAELDALMAALAQLRGGGPGPFGGRPVGPDAPSEASSSGGGWGPRGNRSRGGHHSHGGPQGHGPFDGTHGSGPFGPGPLGRGGRLGGPARLRLLDALAAASHPLTVSEVGESIGVDQPRASRLIQQAVELGLVRREADPDDARRTRVALTDEGARVARGLRGRRREQLSSALADFSIQERTDLVRLLAKLAAAWPDPPSRHDR